MTDALSLIREYTVQKKEIDVREGLVFLGDFVWDVKAKTNYTIWGSGRDGQAKEYYTIEAILFFLENIELTHPQYIKTAIEKFGTNDKNVSRPDRKDLLAYLQGQASSIMSIDRNAPVELGRPRPRSDTSRQPDSVDDVDMNKQEPSERLRNILEKRPGLMISKEDIAEVSDKLPQKTIAEIKTKIQIRKRGLITDTDVISASRPSELSTNNFERVWRTRESILQSTGQNFKMVLNYLEHIKRKESGVFPARPEMIPNKGKPKTEELYSRFNQRRQDNTGSFQINTLGSNTSNSLNALVAGSKRPHRKEEPTILSPSPAQSPPAKKKSRTPIIIVPAAAQSIITLANARHLLEGYKFVKHEDAKKSQPRGDSEVLVQYKAGGRSLPFKVINSVSKLQPDDWERVVAVFVHGPAWQFKGWPILENNDPNSIFKKVLAFHLKWGNKPVEGNVRKWNCQVIELDAIKRHADSQMFRQMWQKIEIYCKRDRPNLRIF